MTKYCLILIGLLSTTTFAQTCQMPAPSGDYTKQSYTYKTPSDGRAGLTLDYYQPNQVDGAPPLIILIHGGAWKNGTSAQGPMVHEAQALIGLGYAVASLNYSLIGQPGPVDNPQSLFPASVKDVLCAVKWLKQQSDGLGFDNQNIAVIGHSAGGHLASMIEVLGADQSAFDAQFGGDADCGAPEQSAQVQAVAAYYPVTNFVTLQNANAFNMIRAYMGPLADDPASLSLASPITYVDPNLDPPFFIVHGAQDSVVPGSQSNSFARRLRKLGVPVQNLTVPDFSHGFYPLNFADSLKIENASPYNLGLSADQVQNDLTPSSCALLDFLANSI